MEPTESLMGFLSPGGAENLRSLSNFRRCRKTSVEIGRWWWWWWFWRCVGSEELGRVLSKFSLLILFISSGSKEKMILQKEDGPILIRNSKCMKKGRFICKKSVMSAILQFHTSPHYDFFYCVPVYLHFEGTPSPRVQEEAWVSPSWYQRTHLTFHEAFSEGRHHRRKS